MSARMTSGLNEGIAAGFFAVANRLDLEILFCEYKFDYLLYGNAVVCKKQLM